MKAQQDYEKMYHYKPMARLIAANPPRARELMAEYAKFQRAMEFWKEAITPQAQEEYLRQAAELEGEPTSPDLRISEQVAHQTFRSHLHPEVARQMLAIFEAWDGEFKSQVEAIVKENPRITAQWTQPAEPPREPVMQNESKNVQVFDAADFRTPAQTEKPMGWVRTQLAKRLPRIFG